MCLGVQFKCVSNPLDVRVKLQIEYLAHSFSFYKTHGAARCKVGSEQHTMMS